MNKTTLFIAIIFSLLLTACGEGDNPSLKLGKELTENYTYDGQEIELEGYLSAKSNSNVTEDGRTWVNLLDGVEEITDASSFFDNFSLNIITGAIKMNFGTEPNSIKFPNNFKLDDVKIYDKDGVEHRALDTKVKIKGTVSYPSKDKPKVVDGKEENNYAHNIENIEITVVQE